MAELCRRALGRQQFVRLYSDVAALGQSSSTGPAVWCFQSTSLHRAGTRAQEQRRQELGGWRFASLKRSSPGFRSCVMR